jgi:hypothetical protein
MTARTMSSDTCQNFSGSARRNRREGQARIVDEDVYSAEPGDRHRDDTVAIGGPAQVRDERQQAGPSTATG